MGRKRSIKFPFVPKCEGGNASLIRKQMRRGTKTHNCRCPSLPLPRSKKAMTWAASSSSSFLCVLDLVVALLLGSSPQHAAAAAAASLPRAAIKRKMRRLKREKGNLLCLGGMLSLATALPRTPLAPGANQWAIHARRGTESNTIFAENVQRIQLGTMCEINRRQQSPPICSQSRKRKNC